MPKFRVGDRVTLIEHPEYGKYGIVAGWDKIHKITDSGNTRFGETQYYTDQGVCVWEKMCVWMEPPTPFQTRVREYLDASR